MAEYRTKSSKYHCEKVDSNVDVSCEYLLHRSSRTGKIDKEALVSFICNKSDKCDVIVDGENGTKPNWKKCIHPLSPK